MKEILPPFFFLFFMMCASVDPNVHLVFVCVLTWSNASFKTHYGNMNANGATCILDCLRLRVHSIKMIYKSLCVARTEYCDSTHTLPSLNHSFS